MRWVTGLVFGALIACTAAGSVESPSSSSRVVGHEAFVRPCSSSVSGVLGAGWRRGEVSAGPVVFVAARGYANAPPKSFGTERKPLLQKVLVVVEGVRPVEVAVRTDDASLAYDESKWGLRNVMPFRLGDPAVRFEPCGSDPRWTQFNGGFILRGPACVPVTVAVDGGSTASTTLSFGAGDCG